MSSRNLGPNGSWRESMDDIEDIFAHARGKETPMVVLPLPDGKMIDVWTFLAALNEVLMDDDSETAFEMVQWLGFVIFDSMKTVVEKKLDKKSIAQIYRKETENFDERFEQFLKSLESDSDGQADKS